MGKRNDNQHWTLPGGHLDHGESPQAAAMREASEETGIELKPDDLHYLGSEHVVTHGGKRLLIHSFVVFGYVDTDTEYDPDQEVQRWVWVDVSRGLPYSVEEALHSPRNTTLKLLGLQTW
jgi:8-oxo-dGTP pyrophosphatase MutT (NUDIX family)